MYRCYILFTIGHIMSIFFLSWFDRKKSCADVFCFLSQQTHQRRDESFGELLQAASTIGDLRNCPVSIFLFICFYSFVILLEAFCNQLKCDMYNCDIYIFYCILNWGAPTYLTTWYCSQFLKYFIPVVLMRLKLLFCFFLSFRATVVRRSGSDRSWWTAQK